MKIGILGSGYVGQAAALFWRQKGYYLTLTTRQPTRVSLLQAGADEVILLEKQSLESFIKSQEVLLVSVAPSLITDNYESTYLQTAKSVAAILSQWVSLKCLLYVSSLSVYGDCAGAWVTEETPIICPHHNAHILYETENIMLQSAADNNIQACIFRLGQIYGPRREISERLKRREPQVLAGSGNSYTNLIHITDVIHALDFALHERLTGIYNLCNDTHLPRKQFYDQICQKEKIALIQWDPLRINSHSGNKRASNQKIKEKGFQFSWPQYIY